MTEQFGGQSSSAQPQARRSLSEVTWEEVTQPGAYVERGSGDLYRIPQEALVPGASPVIRKQSNGASRLIQISRNPFVTTMEARLTAAEHNLKINF